MSKIFTLFVRVCVSVPMCYLPWHVYVAVCAFLLSYRPSWTLMIKLGSRCTYPPSYLKKSLRLLLLLRHTWSHYVALADVELDTQTRLALNAQGHVLGLKNVPPCTAVILLFILNYVCVPQVSLWFYYSSGAVQLDFETGSKWDLASPEG